MLMKALKIKNITTTFNKGKVVANDNVSLEVEEGEFFVLLGPSGCGKSTLLRTIAGLVTPDSGEMYLKDDFILDKEPKDRDLSMMFQQLTLYPNMNVFDNVAFPLKIKGVDKKEREERVMKALEITQIPDKKNANVKSLSGGEAQRAMISRVLVQDPALFLLDEPFSSLDHQLRVHMRKEILRIHQKTNVTIVFVTHNQEEAMRLGDRLAIMNKGRIEQVGTPKQILREPNNKFVAKFIGHPQINLIPAKIEKAGKKYVLKIGEEEYGAIAEEKFERKPESEKVTLGIRPEKVRTKDKNDDKKFVSQVDFFEDTGANAYVHFQFNGTSVQADVTEVGEWERGNDYFFWFKKEDIKLFDNDGKRIL